MISEEEAARNAAIKNPRGTLVGGIVAVTIGALLWHFLFGNPLNELALLRHAKVASGHIVYAWEEKEEGNWMHGATYIFRLPDGREFTNRVDGRFGRLSTELGHVDEQHPHPIEVEYLENDPSVNRIKGDGNDSIWDFLWRRVGVGSMVLLLLTAPGLSMIGLAVKGFRMKRTKAQDQTASRTSRIGF